jgi:hypothetical protein
MSSTPAEVKGRLAILIENDDLAVTHQMPWLQNKGFRQALEVPRNRD